jgi:hypothetical protein
MYIVSYIRLFTCRHIPPELAIGDGTDASLALHLDSFLDGLILHGAQLVLRALLRIKVGSLKRPEGRLSEPMWSARNGGFRRGAADIVVEGREGFSVIAIGERLYSHRQFEQPGTVCHRSCACENPSVSSQIAERTKNPKERACCSPTLFVPAFILITYELAL